MYSILFSLCLFGSKPPPKLADSIIGNWNCNISKSNQDSKVQTLTIEKGEEEQGVLIAQFYEDDEEGTAVPAGRLIFEAVDGDQNQFSVSYENGDDVVKYEKTFGINNGKSLGYLDDNTTFTLRFLSNEFIEVAIFNVDDLSFTTIEITRETPKAPKQNMLQSMLPMIMMFVVMNMMKGRGQPQAQAQGGADKKND